MGLLLAIFRVVHVAGAVREAFGMTNVVHGGHGMLQLVPVDTISFMLIRCKANHRSSGAFVHEGSCTLATV